jgi:uncharacterized protein DUF6267
MTKNTHIPHIEELLLQPGQIPTLVSYLERIKNHLNTTTRENTDIELFYKWDGITIFFGLDPKENKLFVATKSFLNTKADRKICLTEADVTKYHGNNPKLVDMLQSALRHINPNALPRYTVLQGDILFTENTLNILDWGKTEFQPNVVKYTYDSDNLNGLKFGVAVHTAYIGDTVIHGISSAVVSLESDTLLMEDSNIIFHPLENEIFHDKLFTPMITKIKTLQYFLTPEMTTTKFADKFWKSFNKVLSGGKSGVEAITKEFLSVYPGYPDLRIIRLAYVVHEIQQLKSYILSLPNTCSDRFQTNFTEGLVMNCDSQLYKIVDRYEFSAKNFIHWNNK